ncbi:MAG: tetratricopeptide repeat protein [Fibrobacteres bacterium]|nr:tetratricopeptide repeat protein [Fibrobacterota bacterium]
MMKTRQSGFPTALLAAVLCISQGHARPKEGGLRLEVSRQLAEKGEYDKAIEELRLYLSEHPDSPEIHARIGALRMKQGDFKLAGENFKLALSKDPNLKEAREGLATAYEKAGDKARADEEWKKLGRGPGGAKVPPTAAGTTATKDVGEPGQGNVKDTHAGDAIPAVKGQAAIPAKQSGAAGNPVAPADPDFSPALDSGSSKGATGIYAQKEFLEALDLYRKGKADAMAVPLRRSLSKSPGHPGAYYLGGVMRYEKGEYGKALFNFKRSTEYPDRGFNAYFYMGRIYQKQERFDEAIAAFEKYLQSTKSEPGRKQAETYLAQMRGPKAAVPAGKKEAAPETAKDAVKDSSKQAGNESGKEGGHPGEGEKPKDGAEPDSREAHPAEPPKPPAEEAKAMVLGRDGSLFFIIPDAASPSGRKLNEAYDLCKKEKFEKAVNLLKEAVLNYGGSDNADAANLDLASVYLRLGLWESARDRITDYAGPGSSRDSVKYYDAAQYLGALAQLGLKDGEKAERALLRIKPGAANGPDQGEIDYRLAQAAESQKDGKKLSAYLDKAYASAGNPERKASLAQQQGFLFAKYGNTDKAMEHFRKSMADCKDPSLASICAESQLRLADMAFRKKDYKAAMDQYRQFAAKFPGHKEAAWVHYQMANIYKLTNNFESALNEYKRVIDNYPDSYWSSQAKWKREDTIWQKEYEEVLD